MRRQIIDWIKICYIWSAGEEIPSFAMMDEASTDTSSSVLNTTTNCSIGVPYFCPSGKLWKITVLCLLMFFSLVGNSLFTAVFFKNSELRSAVNYFVVNMAISDLVYPVFVLPWRISELYLDYIWIIEGAIGSFFCRFLPFLEQTSVNVSILSMVLIAVERFHSVLFAMRPTLISVKKCPRIITAIWLFATATCAHFFFAWKLERLQPPYGDGCPRCHFRWGTQAETVKVFTGQVILYYIILSAVPWVLLTILYSSIIFALFQQKRNENMASEIVQQRARENRRVTCMLVTVLVVFFLVWLPHYIHLAFYFFAPHRIKSVPCSVAFMMNYLRYTFTIINPLVYFVFSERYRGGLKQLFSCLQLKSMVSQDGRLSKTSVASQSTVLRSVDAFELGPPRSPVPNGFNIANAT